MRRLSAVQRLPFIGKHFGDGSAIRAAIQTETRQTETRQTTVMLGIGHQIARIKTLAAEIMSLWKPATPVIFSQHVCKCQIRLHSHRKLKADSRIINREPGELRQTTTAMPVTIKTHRNPKRPFLGISRGEWKSNASYAMLPQG
jgi:hypothetical protein